MVGLETSSTSSENGARGQKHRGRKKASGEVNGIDALGSNGLSKLSTAELEAKQAHVQLEASRLREMVQRIEREFAERSELRRMQRKLEEANAQISQLQVDLTYARRDAAHAADQLMLQHEADERQWQTERQQRDAELQQSDAELQRLQSLVQRLNADLGQQSTKLQTAGDDLTASHHVVTAVRLEMEELRAGMDTEKARHGAELEEVILRRDEARAQLEEVLRREKALAEEKEHVLTVLAEWQHYGRTRNSDFENALKAIQQKDQEIKALKCQVATQGVSPALPTQTPYPPPPRADLPLAPEPSHGGRVRNSHTGGIGSTQLGRPLQEGQDVQQGLPQEAGVRQLHGSLQPPSVHGEVLEQKIIVVLRQLLPLSESNAMAVTPAFEAALNSRLAPLLWARDVAPLHGNVFDFMVERQNLFLRRRVDGWWYMPQPTLPALATANMQAFFPPKGAEAKAQNLTPRDAPVAPPGHSNASAAITRPSPNGHQRSAAPPGFEQQGVHPDRRQLAHSQHAHPVNAAELAAPLQQLALQQQQQQQRQQAGKHPDPVPRPSSGSSGRVIVTPVHPEGLKLMEERRRQSADAPTGAVSYGHTQPARKPSQPAVLTVPRPSSRPSGNAGLLADQQRRAGNKVQRQDSGVSASSGHNAMAGAVSETASIADSNGASKRQKGRKRNKGNKGGEARSAASPAEEHSS